MQYEKLLIEADQHGVDIYEKPMQKRNKGLYCDKVIWINKYINTSTEKACVLAEELGHYHTSAGNILDQKNLNNIKQEKQARTWAYEKLVPLKKIIKAHKDGPKNKYELAEYLGVTEDFLEKAIERYIEKFGLSVKYKDYVICFEPLGVIEWFDNKNF
ncbi:ImmA/IrrE family metallo-endopeptidase [Amphibacillus xylanus]|uniref:IrrE N-terminal-like domain-containing protein n=1 Tax=Amphibacillus xylanus (strain ATCC 51415 / DSM 6626 / JCM 7361 / LMG 17667 / NBRC 15112 / Ep01) TaxID=698758 RepID=K0IV68_AMPXN|nr:ImmA/IrrE family metallo-endopeptidase [Amphibacillus xylanus]BAM46314.1 hypothetical protein AXY_01820 [Amphibacillus xylanus NBRC 15112]